MKYYLLGNSGLRVSEICLGTMTFGEEWGWGASNEDSRKVFDVYVDAGGNFVDTANNYTGGTSEKYVGEFIASDRNRFVLATKYTSNTRRGYPNAGGYVMIEDCSETRFIISFYPSYNICNLVYSTLILVSIMRDKIVLRLLTP
jgi:aryl-alcohol dehydrogenase-like predicted oxidoreductase